VQKVPEQSQPHDTELGVIIQAVACDLTEQTQHPDAAAGHMQAVQRYQIPECGQETAAHRRRAFGYHGQEVADFETDECQPQSQGDDQPADQLRYALLVLHRQRSQAVGETAEQQQHGFDENGFDLVNIAGCRAAGHGMQRRGVCREHQAEQYGVAHQKYPETEYDGFRRIVGVRMCTTQIQPRVSKGLLAHGAGSAVIGWGTPRLAGLVSSAREIAGASRTACNHCSCSCLTSSAGMVCRVSRAKPCMIMTPSEATAAIITSHQIYQTRPNATMKPSPPTSGPKGLLAGRTISSYSCGSW